MFPIYWDDLTDEEKENGVNVALTVPSHDPFESYYVTVTPTPDWYAFDPSNMETSGKGEPVTYQLIIGEEGNMCMVASSTEMPPEMGVLVNLTVEDAK